ncbi:MAG: hypothetical protein EXQ87_05930 [Alphaproteobacteria bacterium]|nr:hypothetical protein [Alphaproteobacteria bacterium]
MAKQFLTLPRIVMACLAAMNWATLAARAETVRIGGTGAGLAAMHAVGESFVAAHPDMGVNVLASLGSSGGLKALSDGAIDLAIVARLLKPEERRSGVTIETCMTTALVFATSHKAPPGIALADLPGLYGNPRPTWPDGTPLKAILQSRAGSEVSYLASKVPGLQAAFETAYKRADVPVGASDQENADLAEKIAGSFAITTLVQIRAERLRLQVIAVDGIVPTAGSIADKSYPFPMPICLVLPNAPAPGARRFIEHLRSPAGHTVLHSFDVPPPD